jgi:uncharacterized membrane protein YjjP (DUF1212 family)
MDPIREQPPEPAVRFLVHLGRALHEVGFSAPQLEGALARVAAKLGVPARFFTTPTSVFSAFGEEAGQRVHLERVEPAGVDLGRLAAIDALLVRFERNEIDADGAAREVDRVVAAPPAHGRAATLVAFAVGSASSAVFLGGGASDVAAAATIGLGTGVLAALLASKREASRVFEPLAAALGAFAAIGLARLLPGMSVYLATLAGLIVLLPGFTLTVALSELAARHLASGSARFAGALVVFFSIGFGVAFGTRLGTAVFGQVSAAIPVPLPGWVEPLALLVAPLALAVQLKAPLGEALWIVLGGAFGFFGGRVGAALLSPEQGAFFGTLALGLFASLYARRRDRPASIVLVPGLLMLVPGSIGYKTFVSFLARDVVLGLDSAVRMLVVAVSLVAGLLAANVFVPGRRRGLRTAIRAEPATGG